MNEEETTNRKNRNRILMDKAVMIYTAFLWVCFFVIGDPLVWTSVAGILGLFELFVIYMRFGLGIMGSILLVGLVIMGTKKAWDEYN